MDDIKFWKPSMKLSGPAYFYGRTESGKTWKLTALAQIYQASFWYKIWDLGPGRRNENLFWSIPSDEARLWSSFQSKVGIMNKVGPKQYKVNYLIPCFELSLPDKLPQHLPNIQAKVFTLYFKDITKEDIMVITGDLSKNAIFLWNQIVKSLPDNANGADIDEYIRAHYPKYRELGIYKQFIKPAIDNRLLAGKNCPLNINFEDEAEAKDIISVLVQLYIPDVLWKMFLMSYFMRKILFDLSMSGVIDTRNIGLMREAGDYMKKVDKTAKFGEQTQIFRNNVVDVVRHGRSGLILFVDTQSPEDVKGLIEGQEDMLCINEISLIDLEEILVKLRKEKRMPKKLVLKLHDLKQSEMIMVERKKEAKLISPFMPPRCMCYTDKDFLHVWKSKINDWKKSYEDLKIIDGIYDSSEQIINKKIREENIILIPNSSKMSNKKVRKEVEDFEEENLEKKIEGLEELEESEGKEGKEEGEKKKDVDINENNKKEIGDGKQFPPSIPIKLRPWNI